MRIGIDALLLGRFDSGVEIYTRNLIRALARLDAENEYVIYLSRDATPPDTAGRPPFELRRAPFRSEQRAARILWQQGRLPKCLAEDRVDVLHSLGYVMPIFGATPTVVTMHDVIALKFPHLCKISNALHYQLLLPHTARRARRIVASSQATRSDIMDLLNVPAERVDVAYPGVDEAFLGDGGPCGDLRSRYDLPERYILFVGNIEPKKNLAALIEAYHYLRTRRDVRLPLVIVGRRAWKYGPVLDAVRSFGIEDHVLFRGYVPREDLAGIYRMASVFVFPSVVEGFGLPPLEAMAAGVPVVASSAPAVPEAVGEAAITVPPDDPIQLGRAVCKVLENTFLRESLIERGRERVKRFSWAGVAEQMMRIYREVLETEKA